MARPSDQPADQHAGLAQLAHQSGIGKGTARVDRNRVPDQMHADHTIGHDTKTMRAVVGEKALSDDEHKYLEMLNTFEAKSCRITPTRTAISRPLQRRTR